MAWSLKATLILIFCLCSHFDVASSQDIPPKVVISFPDAADSDFNNETVSIVSNSNVIFEMACEAPYPVEWIFHYSEEDDGTSEQLKRAETHRLVDNFNDRSTYRYLAKIRLEYHGKLLVLCNFTCKATESNSARRQTHVYMRDENRKSLLILEISNRDKGFFQYFTGSNGEENGKVECNRAFTTVSYDLTRDWTSCWTCEAVDGPENGLELDFEYCQSPIQCNSMHARQKKGKNCLHFISWEDRKEIPPCKNFGLEIPDYNAKLVLCKNYGPALAQLYFFGIFRGSLENETSYRPPQYFDWSEIDPNEMIFMHPIRKDVYKGESIEFTCEYSTFYFSLGSWFAIQRDSDRSVEYIQGNDIKPCGFGPIQSANCSEDGMWKGTYAATLPTSFNFVGTYQVSCIGPVWNTTQWFNTSVTFDVKQGEKPKVVSVNPDKNEEYFIIGQRNRSLVCNFLGKPKPKVEWSGPNKNYYQIDGDTFSEIVFSEIGYQTAGVYSCKVSSFLGDNTKSFKLESHPEPRKLGAGAITAIAVSCVLVVVVVLAVIFRMKKIIVQQQEALRLLTEAEIQEFINGKPELREMAKNDYFNNPTAIDALPFDQKYEIPLDKLTIDYDNILGSGEFGLVFKGKVHVSQYVNVVGLERQTFTEMADPDGELIVAIKICKKDVDVSNFKALLSEIKIMAWLGHHENVVSLIGASTQRIRERELFIAVEYCHNGSLETYVRRNKGKFLNKVKYGYYTDDDVALSYINLEDKEEVDQLGTEETCIFSSLELFRWTRDIAEAVEYIHSKRVIHGDLALRNVLLTNDLSAKVGDFGLSRQLVETASYSKKTQCLLPWRNMALESLTNLEFSVKSDMWALGVTLWELYTLGDIPYPGLNYTQDFVRSLEDGSVRLVKPNYATNNIYEFMLMCWQNTPADRPTPTEIKIICKKLLNGIIRAH